MINTLTKGGSSLYLTREIVQGDYVAPTLDVHGIEPLEDGLEFNFSVDKIERKTLTNSKEKVDSRLGAQKVEGTIPMELKAGNAPGVAPRGDVLYESLFGGVRTIATSTITTTGNTTTRLNITNAAIGRFSKNDIVLIKEAGAYAVRPILAVNDVTDDAFIDLAIPLDEAPSDGVVIEKALIYHHDNAEPSASASYYAGNEILEKVPGVKVISAALKGWKANETPSMEFKIEALDKIKEVGTPSVAVDFSNDAKVPVVMGSLAWVGQEQLDYIEIGLNLENTISTLPSAAKRTGKLGSRKTLFAVSGSIDPYMAADNVDRWNSFRNNEQTSLFSYSCNYSAVPGEFSNVVAIWMPNIKITNMPAADQDGVLMDKIEFEAFRVAGKDTAFLGFI